MTMFFCHAQQPGIYILCGVVNVIATVTYIGFLYVMRHIAVSSALKIVALLWESILFLVFMLDSSLNVSTSFNKMGYIFSFTGITDTISLLVITSYLFLDFQTAITLQFFRCFRLLKIMQGVKSYPHIFQFVFVDPVPFEILHTCTSVLVLLLVVTGAVQMLSFLHPDSFESPVSVIEAGGIDTIKVYGSRPLFWHECLYFVVVTVTTVGFGDIFPVTTLSRMLMILIIIIAFSLIPTLLSDLVRAFYSRPLYSGSLSLPKERKHILICGIVNCAMLLQLLLELQSSQSTTLKQNCRSSLPWAQYISDTKGLLQPCWSVGNSSVLVVILSPQLPSRKVKLLLDAVLATYARRVMYFVGSTKVTQDLERVKLKDALAVLIVGDEPTSSMRVEEDSIFLSSISISNYLEQWYSNPLESRQAHWRTLREDYTTNPRPRIVTALTHTAKLSPLLISAGVDVVLPLQFFKYSLLGVSAACPGILALFMKLNRPHFETYAQHNPHFLNSYSLLSRANATSGNVNALENLPYLKACGTESSMYQVKLAFFSPETSDDTQVDDNADSCSRNHTISSAEFKRTTFLEGNDNTVRLSTLISHLPDGMMFQDFISVVYRVSRGDVLLIGVSTTARNGLSKEYEILINPGRQVSVNQCLDLFCIAKSRSTAIHSLKEACLKILARESVEGPRGSLVLGSPESCRVNRFRLAERSYRYRSKCNKCHINSSVNIMASDADTPPSEARRSLSAPQLMSSPHGQMKSNELPSFRRHYKFRSSRKGVVPTAHRKLTHHEKRLPQKGKVKNKFESSPGMQAISLKKLSPFSFLHGNRAKITLCARHPGSNVSAPKLKPLVKPYDNLSCNASNFVRLSSRKQINACRQRNFNAGHNDCLDGNTTPSFEYDSCASSRDWPSSDYSPGSGDQQFCGDELWLQNHLVIVLSSCGTHESISAHALLLPIIHLLTAYRVHSPHDKVVLLAERADELHKLATEAHSRYPSVLKGIHYYEGSPRNMDHLRLCGVLEARAVVICHHPTPSTVFVLGDDDPGGQTVPRKLNADRHTIIVSLNLHFLLDSQVQPLPRRPVQFTECYGGLDNFLGGDNYCPFTFTVAEVRHESNAAYLRRSICTISSVPTAESNSPHLSNRTNKSKSSRNRFDLLSAGGLMTAPVFISLMVQSILNPNIVTLWETVLAGRVLSRPNRSVQAGQGIDPNAKCADENISTIQLSHLNDTFHPKSSNDITRSSNNSELVQDISTRGITMKTNEFIPELSNLRETIKINELHEFSSDLPILGRIACPSFYDGLTFGVFFEDLLEHSGAISIGVHHFTVVKSGGNPPATTRQHDDLSPGESHLGIGLFPSTSTQRETLGKSGHNVNASVVLDSDSDSDSDFEQEENNIVFNEDTSSDLSNDFNAEDAVGRSDTSVIMETMASMPHVFVAPSSGFVLSRHDFIFILRGS